jgi:DNA (cytosine-5)-methyltransferase 1
MVGIRKDLKKIFQPPAPTHLKKHKTCKEAIEKPAIKLGASNHDLTKQHPRVVERLQHIKPGENAWTADLPEHLKLNVTGAQISQIYKRLDPAKPAYTITGSGGGGTHVYHWSEDRALTNRERARLQTFPDSFVFEGNKEAIRRQIGMAVPPEGAKVIFEAIIKTLEGIDYKSVPANI